MSNLSLNMLASILLEGYLTLNLIGPLSVEQHVASLEVDGRLMLKKPFGNIGANKVESKVAHG